MGSQWGQILTFDISRVGALQDLASSRSPRSLSSKRFTACVTAKWSLAPIRPPENSQRNGLAVQRTSTAKLSCLSRNDLMD
jgi:hypothetical protein